MSNKQNDKARLAASSRRERVLLVCLCLTIAGVAALSCLFGWYLWRQSVVAEERRLEVLAQRLGERVDAALIDARQLLQALNQSAVQRCSEAHLGEMQEAAVSRPYLRAIGHWAGIERRCGVGFVQGSALTPPEASRIYPNGLVAWWPGPGTRMGDVEFFLMRLDDHDLLIDPRLLFGETLPPGQRAALWVEGLILAAQPLGSALPEPVSLPRGMTIDSERGEILARFSLDTVIPMDVVAAQDSSDFVARYLPRLLVVLALGISLLGLWFLFVLRLSRHHLSLTAELRNAVARGAIRPVYQPIVDLQTGRCCGAEILARWQGADGEWISPEVFIPLAESAGLIGELTLSLLRSSLESLAGALAESSALSLNLNLSVQELEDEELTGAIERMLAEASLPARVIKFELTERALADDARCRARISELRGRGHRVAVDDFGTGYSSLSYLQTFEVDTLKIDKAFVDAIDTEAVNSGVISHIIDMARSLELDTVAEGIESEYQLRWLAERGVKLGQGYFYSKPLAAGDFIQYLRAHR